LISTITHIIRIFDLCEAILWPNKYWRSHHRTQIVGGHKKHRHFVTVENERGRRRVETGEKLANFRVHSHAQTEPVPVAFGGLVIRCRRDVTAQARPK
jgi:hypothetical protein